MFNLRGTYCDVQGFGFLSNSMESVSKMLGIRFVCTVDFKKKKNCSQFFYSPVIRFDSALFVVLDKLQIYYGFCWIETMYFLFFCHKSN